MSAPRPRFRPGTALAVLALALGTAAPVAAQQGVLGEVVAVQKRAEFSLRGQPLRGLRAKMPLVREMRIVTFVDSDALMAYDHPRAMLFLGPETEFVMRPPSAAREYRCPDPELVERLADLEQARGELRLVRERARSECPLRVLTRVAVIVVVGTDLTVRVDPADGTTVVSVAEGAVEVYRRDPETGEPTG
ncbi:MAG TPA: FecR domain-containing protein, partial [Thermoanaerobaculia bacterium]|nr:FecR domain-containing protein [Thermoanaerobaculia bacterium]